MSRPKVFQRLRTIRLFKMREPEAAEDVEPRSIFHLCQAEKCEVHNRVTRYQPTPQELAHRKKEALAERVEKLSRVRILEAMRKKLPNALSRPDLEMVALDYFRRLGHDNHRRLSKLYAWEEKKSKTSWGSADRGLREDCDGSRTGHESRRP